MSSNKKQQQQQKQEEKEKESEVPLCDFCQQPGLSLKACAGCGCEKYCDSTCQKARWPHHKIACKAKRLEWKSEAKAKEAAKERGSGSSLRDMGSIMAALMKSHQPTPQQQRYNEVDLFNASVQNHCKELQTMLRQPGLDVNFIEPNNGVTATYAAAQHGNDKCLLLLISHGADMSKVDKEGSAPIHAACENGRYACLEVLADAGADLNIPTVDEFGSTPVFMCCINGHVNCLALLSARGADVRSADYHGANPAHIASQRGQLKCLQLLAKRGVDLSKKHRDGYTPLDLARMFKQPECIDLLLACGATGAKFEIIPVSEDVKV
jgi:hypothetical protein